LITTETTPPSIPTNPATGPFDGAVIIIGYWRNPSDPLDHGQDDDRLIFAESVDSILGSARRIANERTITPNRPPLKLV
jgi:hypothetical protein